MSESIALLCAGAAKGLALALEPAFTAATGAGVDASFGAVGALVEKLDADAPCDVIVLTSAGNLAVINGKTVRAGSTVGQARVVQIQSLSVEMELQGERFNLGVGTRGPLSPRESRGAK